MSENVLSLGEKAGLPPGSVVHVGEPTHEAPCIDVLSYDERTFTAGGEDALDDLQRILQSPKTVWIKIQGIHDVGVVQRVGYGCGLHPLVMEDIANTLQRPKREDYGDYLFVALKVLEFDREKLHLEDRQVSVILGSGFVVSFVEGTNDPFAHILERIRKGAGRINRMGADFLAYCLIDSVVDGYFSFTEGLEDYVEALEEEVLLSPQPSSVRRLYELKLMTMSARKAVWPLRQMMGSLAGGESDLFTDETIPYLRDVHDHAVQALEALEELRENLTIMFELYHSGIGNRLNEIMKVLTLMATVFIPLTFLTGLYGMNFKYMPELEWKWSYPLILTVMFTLAAGMIVLFRRKKWL